MTETEEATSAPAWTKKEAEALRAKATARAAQLYMERKRAGTAIGVSDSCDLAASETGYPRPAESSVRRAIPKLMTDDEKNEKKQKNAKADRRAEATKRAAELYKEMNGRVPEGHEAAASVTKCCEMVVAEFGVRPAESSLRRALAKLYEEEGMEPPKLKKARPSPPVVAAAPVVPATAAVVGEGATAAAAKPKAKRTPAKRKPKPSSNHRSMPSDAQFAAGLSAFGNPPLPPLPSVPDDVDIVGV